MLEFGDFNLAIMYLLDMLITKILKAPPFHCFRLSFGHTHLKDGPVMVEVKADVKVNALTFEELFQAFKHPKPRIPGAPASTAAVVPPDFEALQVFEFVCQDCKKVSHVIGEVVRREGD